VARQLRKSWLDAYLEYTTDTENPESFNLWAGVSAISASLKRKVFIWRNFIQFFPNQYIVLVGPPGIGKGSAIHPSINIVNEVKSVNYLSDKITAEKIIAKLADGFTKITASATGNLASMSFTQDHTATILSKELPVFLSSSEWMHSLLCQLWDENTFEYETKNKGSYKVDNMCVGMLAGCVPDFIRMLSTNAMAAITGGFTARTVFVYATEKSKLISGGWGKPSININRLKDQLINDLDHISKLEGEFTLDANALALWDAKYSGHNAHDEFESDVSSNFKSRLSSHIIKLAMTVSIAECDNLVITELHLDRAMRMLEAIRDEVDIVFRSIGESPLAVSQERVRRFIFKQGQASREEILRINYRHITDEQLTSILMVLLHSGHIQETTQGSKTAYLSLDSA
jgi:Protein of unknown function (DUF3987)